MTHALKQLTRLVLSPDENHVEVVVDDLALARRR
jgi:hypothetical protein